MTNKSRKDVFLVFRNRDDEGRLTRDGQLARTVCEYLTGQGLSVFISSDSLEQLGVAEYTKAIDDGLDAARVVVVVGTSRQNLESPWVRYQWNSFFYDTICGVKPAGRLFGYIEGITAQELPRALRQNPILTHSEAALNSLCNFVCKALGVAPGAESHADSRIPPQEAGVGTPDAYQLPPLSLLSEVPANREGDKQRDVVATGRVIVQTLEEFRIKTEVKAVERGPVVTQYELLPEPGVKLEKIAGLCNNLALSLRAKSIRVQAPIPGKGTVGIEVPNESPQHVYLRQMLEGEEWQHNRMELPLVLGRDIGGKDIIVDLATMPHLLIAGTTGSGKTVALNSILAGLCMCRTPEQCQFMLVDPKIVEFSEYRHLPHLLGKRNEVICDPKRVSGALRWAIGEMERRYKLFARTQVRNIKAYNNRSGKALADDKAGMTDLPERLSYIVIVVDELADLMMTAPVELESYIARLAQLSRATGIHMILATQRPSVNVITGTIKANFPARIAFQVAQKIDSRTILDAHGAEKLLGCGDMLYMASGSPKLIRIQGALTTDEDTRRIVDFIKKQRPVAEDAPEPSRFEAMLERGGESTEESLLREAIKIIRETRRVSASSLQRRLKIGYTRAARIVDMLEERGVVGPADGAQPRDILMDLDGSPAE